MVVVAAVVVAATVAVVAAGEGGGYGGVREAGDAVFTSTSNFPDLANLEAELVSHLEDYLTAVQQKINIIRRYVSEYRQGMGGERGEGKMEIEKEEGDGKESSSGIEELRHNVENEDKDDGLRNSKEAESGVRARSSHPVSTFLLLRRLAVDWSVVETGLQSLLSATRGVVRKVGGALTREGSKLPVPSDLHGTALALVRLQYTYDLDLTSLRSGTIITPARGHVPQQELRDGGQLGGQDCLYLGKVALTDGHLDQALDWLSMARNATNHETDSPAVQREILTYLNVTRNLQETEDQLRRKAKESHQVGEESQPAEERQAKESQAKDTQVEKMSEAEEQQRYLRLCRGEQLMGAREAGVLVCRLAWPSPAHHLLAPLLLEEVSRRPYIVLLHRFLSHNQTRRLAAAATPKLEVSRHRGPEGGFVASTVRTSKTAWLRENREEEKEKKAGEEGNMGGFLTRLTRRIEAATRLHALQPSAAEDYQVASYGVGGMYVAHSDYLMTSNDPTQHTPWEHYIGDRLTTFLIYLSEVGGGGATVFPRAGVGVWPERGTAVVWWNLDAAGRGDPKTWHAACPVIYGTKWICNKWVHYNDQFLCHPCGLHPSDKICFP